MIHLLEEPYAAIKELERVCKTGGKIIIPTYINASNGVNKKAGELKISLAGIKTVPKEMKNRITLFLSGNTGNKMIGIRRQYE